MRDFEDFRCRSCGEDLGRVVAEGIIPEGVFLIVRCSDCGMRNFVWEVGQVNDQVLKSLDGKRKQKGASTIGELVARLPALARADQPMLSGLDGLTN